MFDRFDRPITYLRISVTDKCNLRCRYCMPPEGVAPRRHEDLISFEQMTEVARAAVRLGVHKDQAYRRRAAREARHRGAGADACRHRRAWSTWP